MVLFLIKLLLLPIPNLPGLPEEIEAATGVITDYVNNAVGFVSYIITPGLLVFMFTAMILVFNLDIAYKAIMWTLGKIPWINIH